MEPLSLPFVADPEGCSRAGAMKAEGSASRQCMELLTAYRTYGPMNDRQAEAVTGIKDTTICARRRELFKRGLIQIHGKAKAASGVLNCLWGLTTASTTP